MNVTRLDHLVLTVADLEATCQFYSTILGMEQVEFGEGRLALRFGEQKLNLHEAGNEYKPNAADAAPGTQDLCFITTTPLEAFVEHLRDHDVEPELGIVERTGAVGPIRSVYLRDPDGNLIEVSNYQE
jgi:catechol 2,3-dioxygenase-like lactoylglutathione lyase family enzyme